MKVKICGITNLDDACTAVQAGADYLGFVLWPLSKRAVRPDVVKAIAGELLRLPQRPLLVGVFVDETSANIAQLLDTCQLDLAQLHGAEPPDFLTDPHSRIYARGYKALRPISFDQALAEAWQFIAPQRNPLHPSLLIDAHHPVLPGGSGQRADWSIASRLAQAIPGLMLAGGLTPDNVSEAIDQVHPFAVDVSSGVESQPGRKDDSLIRAFVTAAKMTVKPCY